MIRHNALSSKGDIGRFYVKRRKDGRELVSIEDCIDYTQTKQKWKNTQFRAQKADHRNKRHQGNGTIHGALKLKTKRQKQNRKKASFMIIYNIGQ